MSVITKVIVPTLNGGCLLQACVDKLGPWKHRLLVLDSESKDGTIQFLKTNGIEWIQIKRSAFNHGHTREWARKRVSADILVFLTQDVLVTAPQALDSLIQPIVEGRAEVAYGRQLPRPEASFFERFPREFNYPEISHIRSLADIKTFGPFTFFCSDCFAAYSQKALDAVGGFDATLTHEDYFTVAKILSNGGRIAYVAEAEAFHSHNYSLWQEFQRYFDAGYVRAGNPWVTELVGQVEYYGSRFFKTMIQRLLKFNPFLIPYALIQSGLKWVGFRMGYLCFRGPTWLKKVLSGQAYFFDSKFYIPGKN